MSGDEVSRRIVYPDGFPGHAVVDIMTELARVVEDARSGQRTRVNGCIAVSRKHKDGMAAMWAALAALVDMCGLTEADIKQYLVSLHNVQPRRSQQPTAPNMLGERITQSLFDVE